MKKLPIKLKNLELYINHNNLGRNINYSYNFNNLWTSFQYLINLRHLKLQLESNKIGKNDENLKLLVYTFKYLSNLENLELNL